MKTSHCIVVIFFLAVVVLPVYGQDIQKADQLGEEFQRQMPYSKPKIDSGETPGQPQPEDYTAPPEREKSETAGQPQGYDAPLCYNPHYGNYERCYPQDSDDWRSNYDSPHFQFWWQQWRNCPPGYHFRPGWGCMR